AGALVLRTGEFTGRTPRDRYIVRDEVTADSVAWGAVNQPLSPEHAAALEQHLRRHIAAREAYVVERHAGGPEGLPVRVVTTSPAHALFARHLFQAARPGSTAEPLTLLHAPE